MSPISKNDTISKPAMPAPVSQINLILLLFTFLRLSIILLYTPTGLLNSYTDIHYYYNIAKFSQQGYYPFINMWFEYPPILAYLVQGAFSAVSHIMPIGDFSSVSFRLFAILISLMVFPFEAGVLVLIHRITQRVWDLEHANWVSWVYIVLTIPLYYGTYSHNNITTFWLLLAIERFIYGFRKSSAVALGLGIATKITPIFLLGPVIKWLWGRWRESAVYTILAGITAAVTYVPFLILGAPWVVASFRALINVASWSTIWALIDGNPTPRGGYYGPLTNRLDLHGQVLYGNPPAIPIWVILLVFGAIYLFVFFSKKDLSQREWIWFITFTTLLFYLWSKGWSPQYATGIIPLLLIAFPNRKGINVVLCLTVLIFIETPLASAFESNGLLAVSIIGRTVLFTALCIVLARRLRQPAVEVLPVGEV